MTVQTLVDPANIETELLRLWSACGKEKTRACLFNLIVFNKLSSRTDYIRNTVKSVSEKYPCRVLFISLDPEASSPYLKTAVSVVGEGSVACDYIDLGVSETEMERVPFIILPHILPDLPVSLLWTESLSTFPDLFKRLSSLATRVIFDSESEPSLLSFSQQVLELKNRTGLHIADLNWARTEGWRDLVASLFRNSSKSEKITKVYIGYNARETEVFCHVKVQSFYLLAWISTRLKWSFQSASQKLNFSFSEQTATLEPLQRENLGSGAIISMKIEMQEEELYDCERIPPSYQRISIKACHHFQCEEVYQYVLGSAVVGQSLVKEIITRGTSEHYLETLGQLAQIDRDKLC